jgi:hypothetical protein
MEETAGMVRINYEGHGVPRSHRRYEVNTKHIFAGVGVATVFALSSPVYAGILGGGGGGFGGGLSGGLSGMGGRSIGGAGTFGTQGQLTGTTSAPKVKPVVDATKSTAQSMVDSTKNAAGNVADSAKSTAQTTVQNTKDVAGNAVTNAAADASTVKNEASNSLSSTSASLNGTAAGAASAGNSSMPVKQQTTPAKTLPTESPSHSANLSGSLDADHSKGLTTVSGGGNGSLN